MTKSLAELLEFVKSTSQRLCQNFNSKVKVKYLNFK